LSRVQRNLGKYKKAMNRVKFIIFLLAVFCTGLVLGKFMDVSGFVETKNITDSVGKENESNNLSQAQDETSKVGKTYEDTSINSESDTSEKMALDEDDITGEKKNYTEKNISEVDDWKLVLVNSQNPLAEDYIPELAEIEGEQFDIRAVDALAIMLNAAREYGLSPIICSGYRSISVQSKLFDKQVEAEIYNGYSPQEAQEVAASVVAYPATSEHNLGLAADIVAESNQRLTEEQENTAEQQWLMENCAEYGFILRYPKNKQYMTGVIYEPWHYRYVGVEAATEIMSRGICLEEYLAEQ